jgi:molecular chaperone DnaK (HSP70)
VAEIQQRVVGIDLGTTNSLIAFMQGDAPAVIPGEDGSAIVPSVVAFDQDTLTGLFCSPTRPTPSTPSNGSWAGTSQT